MSLLTLLKPPNGTPGLTRMQRVTPVVAHNYTAPNTYSRTSGHFDVKVGDLIVVTAHATFNATVLNTPTWTGTGTFVLRQSVTPNNYSVVYLWTTIVDPASALNGRTVTVTNNGQSDPWGFDVTIWRNHGGLGVTGQATNVSGAPQLDLTTSANSAVQTAVGDYLEVAGTRTWRTINGTPMVEAYRLNEGGYYTIYGGYHLNVGAAGVKSLGLTAPTGQKYSIVGVEILASATNLNKAKTGSSLINAAKVGSSNVSKMYVGSTQVWP